MPLCMLRRGGAHHSADAEAEERPQQPQFLLRRGGALELEQREGERRLHRVRRRRRDGSPVVVEQQQQQLAHTCGGARVSVRVLQVGTLLVVDTTRSRH